MTTSMHTISEKKQIPITLISPSVKNYHGTPEDEVAANEGNRKLTS